VLKRARTRPSGRGRNGTQNCMHQPARWLPLFAHPECSGTESADSPFEAFPRASRGIGSRRADFGPSARPRKHACAAGTDCRTPPRISWAMPQGTRMMAGNVTMTSSNLWDCVPRRRVDALGSAPRSATDPRSVHEALTNAPLRGAPLAEQTKRSPRRSAPGAEARSMLTKLPDAPRQRRAREASSTPCGDSHHFRE
jgi:hypothetical protein